MGNCSVLKNKPGQGLNLGLPWTNPASSQGGTWSQGLWMAHPAL